MSVSEKCNCSQSLEAEKELARIRRHVRSAVEGLRKQGELSDGCADIIFQALGPQAAHSEGSECSVCKGTGAVLPADPFEAAGDCTCYNCDGSGLLKVGKFKKEPK